jgi:hypothetical protein
LSPHETGLRGSALQRDALRRRRFADFHGHVIADPRMARGNEHEQFSRVLGDVFAARWVEEERTGQGRADQVGMLDRQA